MRPNDGEVISVTVSSRCSPRQSLIKSRFDVLAPRNSHLHHEDLSTERFGTERKYLCADAMQTVSKVIVHIPVS